MNPRTFRYPSGLQMAKNLCMVFVILMALLLLAMIFKNKPADYDSIQSYYLAFLWPPIFVLIVMHFVGSYSDVTIDDMGITLTFLLLRLDIPWKHIKEITHVGPGDSASGWYLPMANTLRHSTVFIAFIRLVQFSLGFIFTHSL